jgi:hypothetical protein
VSHVIPKLNRFSLRVLLVFLCISGIFAYSYIDRTVYTTEELLIIPSGVTADGFDGIDSVLVQDVDGDALYQNFSSENSAFIIKKSPTDTPSTAPNIDIPLGDEDADGNEVTTPSEINSEGDSALDTTTDVVEVDTPVESSEQNADSGATAPTEETSVNAPVSLLPRAESYPWAQFDETTSVIESDAVAETPASDSASETAPDESVVIETETTPEVTDVIDLETDAQNEDTSGDVIEENVTIDGATPTEGSSGNLQDSTNAQPLATTTEALFGIQPCRVEEGCVARSLTFDNFAMPEFVSGTVLDSIELRLSLAAKAKVGSPLQRFVVSYSLDGGVSYQPGTVIEVNGEVSNSINGDYFLVALDVPPYTRDVSGLRVRVAYEGIDADIEEVYVDGLWIDVTSGSFYEADDFATTTDAIAYERDLAVPEMNDLLSPDLDVVLGGVPEFTFEYQQQQNFFKRLFNALFGENTFAVTEVTLEHDVYGAIDIPYEIVYHDDNAWTLKLPNTPQKMHPGKYRVKLTIDENESIYNDTFEFYWGVLAVNTTKTRYTKDEAVTFNLAALTDEGDTICDASLYLQVISPSHVFYDVPVTQSGSCGENNVTDVPDYLAHFVETNELGEYTVVLEHRNQAGEMVHKITDRFEVAEFIPYDIERTAPTRIYPPAMYDVKLKITANRTYEGDIIERVPRGFVVDNLTEGALIETLPEATLIKWPHVNLAEGEVLELSYRFDAPDISPYMYLLGPLEMDGYKELRAWQIASDALSGIGWFNGTRTVNGTNLNASPSQLQWSSSSVDTYYYDHSTTTDNERVTLRQAGDYFVAVTLPQQRTDGNNSRTRVGLQVRVNGVAVPQGLGRSGYIRNANGHAESSSHTNFLLTDISPDDYIEVFAEGLTTIDAGDVVNVTGQASMYLEYISSTETVFAATTTATVASTSFNTTASPLTWTETRQDTGFVHSNTVNPENITISNPGVYLVQVSLPLAGTVAQQSVLGRVRLDGALVNGGIFAQGYMQSTANEGDADGSIHWSGIVVATTTNQVLTITTEQEAAAGTVTVPTGFVGSIYIQPLPTTDTLVVRGRNLVGGTDWSPAAAAAVQWDTQVATSSTFTHSTSSNSHQITVNKAGDYYITFNGAFTQTVNGRSNNRIVVQVGGTDVVGAQVKSNYIRNQSGHSTSSSALSYLLTGLATSSVITVTTFEEANNATVNDSTDAILMLWKKADVNERAVAPTYFDAPFDNVRFASTTPYFDFVSSDPDGTSDIQYEFSISTTSDFATATIRTSGVDAGFTNTIAGGDTSPFTEGNRIRFQLQSGDALSDLVTYYWRVRAKDVTGSNSFGDWSTTQSLTVDLAADNPYWYQTTDAQFSSDTLVGAISSGGDGVVVDAADNTEILIAYGEGTNTTPRYRLWGGTSWGIEQNAIAVGGTINWVATAAGVTRDEYVMVTLDGSNATYAQVYQASSSAWGNQVQIAAGVPAPQYRGIAVAYESLSGDAMVVSCDTTPDPTYRIWNGSSWSATSSINASSLANCNYLTMASDPASDEIIVVTRDTGAQYEAHVWDGNGWIESRILGSSPVTTREGMTVAYEASGEQAVIVTANGTNNNFAYTTWDGTGWSLNATQAIANDFSEGRLVSDTNSDQMLLCYLDINADTFALWWDGGNWVNSSALETTSNGTASRSFDCEFETTAGRTNYAIVPYSDNTGVRYRTATSTPWVAEASVDTIGDSFWVQTERADDGTIVMVALDDNIDDDYISSYWNGSSWSTKDIIETNPSSVIAAPYEPFHMSAKRFQFTQGVARSQPIDFDFVSNQPTWGDITFSSTEPFGTDVLVRVRYTNTTTCDTLVPDGVLAGNSAGFDTTELPIDISGLSTTTYSQLCLEATITTLGSASASLDDWALTWVREPKLLQSNYRWYANGSFLTPTDPWPLGVSDLAEMMSVESTAPVNNGDVIRLRIALEGSNVTVPTSTEMFKLQYTAAPSCSAATTWTDVGETGSTTALWRGYANSIVGSDWYNAAWPRRIKISVDNALVSGTDITNFPVYINLDDLPSQFFDSVQSDGDDIRITTSDGVTEVPYELVSIDTVGDTGELHFRTPTLSTTTDTDFYIYYGNTGASGYSVSATYGRNNVWSNNYLLVYHLDQSPTASAPQYIDSTGNSNGTATNLEVGDRQNGMVGRFVALDGTNEYIDLGASFNRSLLRSTWQIWASTSANQGAYDGLFFTRGGGGGTTGINVSGNTSRMGYHWNDAANTYSWTGGPTYGTSSSPYMISLVVEPTQAMMYRHSGAGIATGTNAVAHATATVTGLDFGQDPSGGRLFAGGIDEVSLSSVVRSAGWLSTTYNNRSNPTGFYAVSAEEFIGDGRLLPSRLLSTSDKSETYEENNPTLNNLNGLLVGESTEWDFVLENNNAAVNTNYCFRMVYANNAQLSDYATYPEILTNAAPLAPTLSAPFDNEQFASTTPWFEFVTSDEAEDVVSYEIEVDDDYAFGSPNLTSESNASFSEFTNLSNPAERGQYTSSQLIRFVPSSALTTGTTYYWRVRAKDDLGSNAYGEWSAISSFTITSGISITTWHQTTGEQLATNNLDQLVVSTSSDDVRIDTALTAGTTTSTVIDFADRDTGNAWGALAFSNNVTSGSIRYRVEYRVSGETFALIPDTVLAGNSAGFTSSPVSLASVNPESYSELRIVAVFSGNDSLPRLLDWTVTWGLTIEEPTQLTPFDNAKVATTTPTFTFTTTDPQSDDLQYEFQLSTTSSFTSPSTFISGVDVGFVNIASGGDTSPFNSGNTIRYTAQSALTNGQTYWWRTRARDPLGTNAWSDYSDPESFTIDTGITVSVWHQTTGEQFATDELTDIETTVGGAQITSVVREVMMAYGEGTGQSPRYRIWDGSAWGAPLSAASIGATVRWTQLRAAPTRSEYALGTIGSDSDINIQIYDGVTEIWGDMLTLNNNLTNIAKRGFDIAYESSSGDLLAVSCVGTDAVFSVWNGTSWTATSSITLTNANDCSWVQMASDPTSDEIVAVFRHVNTSNGDYEALVWDGSGWDYGSSIVLGNLLEDAYEGMAVQYEESGDQAVVVVSSAITNGPSIYTTWDGVAWAATSTATGTVLTGDHMEWGSLRADVGTDRLALCQTNNDDDIEVTLWDGSAFGVSTELDAFGSSRAGQPVDCEFETIGDRDGYLMVPYSDNGAAGVGQGGRYQFFATSTWSGEQDLSTIEDSWRVIATRGADGIIHAVYLDDAGNNQYVVTNWDGSTWAPFFTIAPPPTTGTPFDGYLTMAAQIYPNFTAGSVRSTSINFSDGAGPRWEAIRWNDTTPGASDIRYRLYYQSTSSAFLPVPDSALSGNAAGFTTSPVSIAGLDRTVYSVLQLEADLSCVAGNCPTIQDWSLEWSEGINVSGQAYEYSGTASTTSGTVGVVVNGVLQSGKTGTILANGTWSIANVSAFEGDSIMVFVDGATEADEAVAYVTYDGVGDVTNMELTKRHLTVGSSDTATTTNTTAVGYDYTDDEDIFVDISSVGAFDICAEGCADHRIKIKSGTLYVPAANLTTHDFVNYGTLKAGTTTIRVRGSWNNQAIFTPETSTVILTATSTSESLTASSTSLVFYNLTIGETTGTATFTPALPLDIDGSLRVDWGTLARGTSTFAIARDLFIGIGGRMSGMATTTFDGSSSFTWTDQSASSTNVGHVVIDGTAKTITLGSAVLAESITIGSDDTLNASGSGFNLSVVRNWTNNNLFVPQSGTVTFVGTSTGVIARGTSAFNNLTFSGVGGNWSFSTSTLALNGSLTIATGTVTLPTGTTTIAGSFLNTGGTFAHNNGEVRMTSTVGGRSVTVSGQPFINAFYDLVFTGSGSWTFTDSATTSRDLRITAGTVTFPASTLTIAGDLAVSGSGSFVHNSGEVIFLVQGADTIATNGSSLNNIRTRSLAANGWYNDSWSARVPVTVRASQVSESVTNFPVYLDLSTLPSSFFSTVQGTGADIRVTASDGVTELPFEVVRLSTSTATGELHFRANSLSNVTDTAFYIYYGNSAASAYAATDTYGRNNVWSNGYMAVYHLNETPGASYISSTGSTTGSANNMEVGDVVAAQVGFGQQIDGTNEFIQTTFAASIATSTWSLWARANGTQSAYDGLVFSRGTEVSGFDLNSTGGGIGYHWNNLGATAWNHVGPTIPLNTWFMASMVVVPTQASFYRFATSGLATSSNVATHNATIINDLKFGQDDAGGRFFTGIIDEVRIANVARTQGWLTTEYNNQATPATFYNVGGAESRFIRIFSDSTTTILGDYVAELGGNTRFPSGTLLVGGSFDNNASFESNNGTVRFNSTAGAETIAAGSSTFATLDFNAAAGDFTVIEHATATVALNLTAASQFTLQSGLSLTASGTFSQAMSGTSTTWTGSILRFLGSDQTIHGKTFGGDTYATVEASGDTDIAMWNSSATTYSTLGTASFYSQDNAGVDGDLYIYGNYIRTTGTEYWSYATDFDGVALGVPRQVDVRIGSSSIVGFSTSSFQMLGTSVASTTVAPVTGSYTLNATNTSITAQYFTVAGAGQQGFGLLASTTLTQFEDGYFEVLGGQSGIRIDGTTISTNPAKQLNRIAFATTTAGLGTNVTFTGTSTSFVWFKSGSGNLYGEAFDAGDSNPGAVRFDDSSYLITVSGRVMAQDGAVAQGSPVCDGATANVRLVVNSGSYVAQTSCNATTGAYSFSNVAFTGDPKISVYLNTNGGITGAVVTKTPTGNVANLDIYTYEVMLRHEGVAPMTIADLTLFNVASDTDMRFTATTTPTPSLLVYSGNGLVVAASSTFAPAGDITLAGNASSSAFEGSLTLATSSTFTATGTETHTLGGRLVVGQGATLSTASSTFLMVATTTGKSITASSTLTFNNLSFTGSNGAWHLTAPLIIGGNMTISTGTVTGTNNINVVSGQLSGNGTLSLGAGTTTLGVSNTLGGTTPWTFANLVLGNGTVAGTTTLASSATTTISGRLTIANAHTFTPNNAVIDLTGAGTVFTNAGTFTAGTSLVRYSGAGATVLGTTYYDLSVGALAGTATFTGNGTGILVNRQLIVGNGSASSTFTLTASDPVFTVMGDTLVQSGATLSLSDLSTTTFSGSYDNNGTLQSNGGIVAFTGSSAHTIAAGNSTFARVVVNGTGSFAITESATTTTSLILQNHSLFTVATSATLAAGLQFENRLGGSATDFAGTLYLYGGGAMSINTKATSDTYGTLSIAPSTRVRMWNSNAGAFAVGGGLYSQDHASTNGLLRIYGTFTETTANDYWSYATDFDGTSLSGGSERAVTVEVASGGVVSWLGGSLSVVGTSTASTSIKNQGSGFYDLTIGGAASTTWNTVTLRDLSANGIVFTGAPTVTDFSRTDHLVQVNSGSAITVGGTAINANEAKNFTNNSFVANGGVTGAINVTATGTAVSSWRFTNHVGALSGEANDVDPTGDPGYVVWDDSAALITVSGNVYSDEGVTVSGVCDGVTNNVVLRVAGLTTYSTSCNATTGAYTLSGVAFNSLDSLVLYIDGETEKAAHVTKSPISSINNMHLYENRIIVRHENTAAMTIADMAVWDSSDDADIPFTAVTGSPNTLSLGANKKLIVWTGKTFAPEGNVTLAGGGVGDAVDGTLEAYANARFRVTGTETHSIAGNFTFGTGAVFEAGSGTTTFTSVAAGRTIDVNEGSFYNVNFSGSGGWTISDTLFTTTRSYTQSAGTVTFGSGTTTIGGSFNATGGSFTMSGQNLVFTSTSTGNIVRFDDSTVPTTTFSGAGGSWTMTDTNATTTGSVLVTNTGSLTLPSGVLAVGQSFINASGTIVHNTADIMLTGSGTLSLKARGSDLFALRKTGNATVTVLDDSVTFRDDVTLGAGSFVMATNTTSIGGSFNATGGTFTHSTGTVLFNATTVGKTINASTSPFYNVSFGSASGGWTWLGNATTTNNLTFTTASSFTKESGTTLAVGGVLTNLVGGAPTTWTNTILRLTNAASYTVNTKTSGGDDYATLDITQSDIRMWNSSAATTTLGATASVYSQDNAGVDGNLFVYGDFGIATTTEYWSYATDFDGTALTGPSQRAVTVRMATNATTTLSSGVLNIIGGSGATTTIGIIGTGTHAFIVGGGTFNAQYYRFDALNASGVVLSGTPSITTLSNGYYQLAVNSGTLLTVNDTALNANASKIFTTIGFNASSGFSGVNVALVGSTSNAWRFNGTYGTLSGESFDNDGIDACGSIRFDNSACLLTSQTSFRWRSDDGGEGAPTSEWYDTAWDYRQRVRIENTTATAFATTTVKVVVAYDSAMQSDFDDIRFTTNNGVTPVDYWIERYTASTEAVVWVEVPSMAANTYTTVFMYYGNSSSTSSSSPSSSFSFVDDFEDNNITEYSGDTSLFQTDTNPVYGGTYALEAQNKSGRTTDGIYRTGTQTAQGSIIRWRQYVDTSAGSSDEGCTLFGLQSNQNLNYGVCLELYGTDRIALSRDIDDNDVSGTVMASTTVTYTTGWYEVEVDWQTSNRMDVYLYNPSGTLVATTSATNSTYTSGGLGFTFWVQNGAWDSYTVRGRGPINPPVTFGAKQTDGGATWLAAENAAGSGLPGDVRRLRIGIENSGLTVTGQTYRLQYAAKGTSPSCEAVSSGSFAAVPNQASCGSSPVCMQTSTQVTDSDPTTDLLTTLAGIFSAGKVVESPSNVTSGLTVNQDYYTELEYVITPTLNAADAYCFRVVNDTTPLDYYGEVAELGLQFDPTLGPVTLNNGLDISLTPNATTTVYATGTVTDFNGYTDIVSATATVYRSGVGPSCSADNNNCYISTTGNNCSFTNCSGNVCTVECRVDIYFHADPTDAATYEGEEWLAYLEVSDAGAGYDFGSASGVELLTLRALSVDSGINYGSLAPNDNTGTYNPTTTIANIGNVPFDIEVEGTDLSDGGSSVIPADRQKFATSTFSYAACATCSLLSSSTPVELPLNLAKPTAPTPPVTTPIYWGIEVPYGVASAAHQGINVFTPISP